ncbi:Energy-conserving hydrogenase (ferredoxin), subunit F [Dehalococcoides mccartyi]|jgi:ech hydrogenase subunit F|nr:energy-conserving hydrogenase (ferredoxin), subunit F [Dehalococcoides mccartyi]RAL69705.1 Energy-conserving hydrogenase (ferredoxin), subunit F [Dehalococcoides mccartyi]RAL71031.1 Energy-conserving hydrogenase (ferredoxin), subunit F [Dehalococcoides mccartyi]
MIGTVLKNLFSAPATRRYPYEKRESFEGSRGSIVWDAKRCDMCSDCARVCPARAITVDSEKHQIEYDPLKCIYCGTCTETCLQHAIIQHPLYAAPQGAHASQITEVHHYRY